MFEALDFEVIRKLTSIQEFSLDTFCFDKQLSFIEDKNPFKVAVCSRRAGKTVACAAHLVWVSLCKERQVSLYITLSRNNAKKIIWNDLLDINRKFNLGAQTNETELSLKFPNESVIYLSGAKDKSEIEKFRGLALSLCYIDECQSFRNYIQELVDEVIAKALFDYNGTLCLIGTPGPVPSGYFYECWTNPQWSKHGWTMFDNPFLEAKSGKKIQDLIDQDLKRKGVTIEHPSIQRECYGRWTVDTDALVFKYSKQTNDYQSLPVVSGKWEYIIGVDIGFEDADAVSVIGWTGSGKFSYLVEEVLERKQGITELARTIERLIEKYNPNAVVMDTGGLGKKIAEEINKRYSLPIKPAEKVRKFEFIELLNDAMRTGKFMAKATSRFAQDCMLVEWDKDNENPERLKVSDKFHSDICDAVLYAFRESLHWLYEEPIPAILPGTSQWVSREIESMENMAHEAIKRKTRDPADLLWDNALGRDGDWE